VAGFDAVEPEKLPICFGTIPRRISLLVDLDDENPRRAFEDAFNKRGILRMVISRLTQM